MLDRDISQRTWNGYLTKYSKDYVLFTDEIGITSIKLKKGLGCIQPYSIPNKQLHAILTFRSAKHMTYWKNHPIRKDFVEQGSTQMGSQDMCIQFPESEINLWSNLLSFYRRKNLSTAQRQAIADRFKGSKPNVEVC